jgi:hypothetical protein
VCRDEAKCLEEIWGIGFEKVSVTELGSEGLAAQKGKR